MVNFASVTCLFATHRATQHSIQAQESSLIGKGRDYLEIRFAAGKLYKEIHEEEEEKSIHIYIYIDNDLEQQVSRPS